VSTDCPKNFNWNALTSLHLNIIVKKKKKKKKKKENVFFLSVLSIGGDIIGSEHNVFHWLILMVKIFNTD